MEFEEVLNESFKRYKLTYSGTRPDYEINDENPYVLSIDDDYNVDGHGKSILGINLNYYSGDVKKLIDDVNRTDNEAGYRGFDGKVMIRKHIYKDKQKSEEWISRNKKQRYLNLIENFPYLGKFIRRYKVAGIQSQRRAVKK